MKRICVLALLGLAACAAKHDNFIYEVTEQSAEEVRVQTHQGMLRMEKPGEVEKGLAHMQSLATNACRGFGKASAVYERDRRYSTGPYYQWVERIYRCE